MNRKTNPEKTPSPKKKTNPSSLPKDNTAPVQDNLGVLQGMRIEATQGGGTDQIALQHQKGKLSARERIDLLLDEGSFPNLNRSRAPGKLGPG